MKRKKGTQVNRKTARRQVRRPSRVKKKREQRRRPTRKTTRRIATPRRTAPQTAKELFARPRSFQEQWKDTTHVVSKVREGASFQRAAEDLDTSAATIVRLAGSALRRLKNGRYVARAQDRLLRVVYVPDDTVAGGMREVATRDSRQATRVSLFWHALHQYQSTGDATGLLAFRGTAVIDAGGKRVPLLTDLARLDRLGEAGVFGFESIYARRR